MQDQPEANAFYSACSHHL